ncbi:MAG: ABC-F family ATP-binding cassette domain-containing protein [Planctomycetes bacterium]|nr:ABC-F family ATP-binding cassette domain-containing protein [Planctomycetota bacterium]
MTLLHLDGLQKHFGPHEVLRGASLRIDPGEKVGLVGRNGGGKTTLLRMIEGLEQPDWGAVTLRKGARLGYVPQRPEFEPGVSVRAFVESGLDAIRAMRAELESVHERVSVAQGVDLERLLSEQDRLHHQLDSISDWDAERNVEVVLSGIGLGPQFWEREAATLSGGEKSRVALARVLVAGADLLLLDEPTNHLDLAGIEWIEDWIARVKSAVLVVSHDRRLLDNAVSSIYELEHGALERYPGNLTAYLALKEERFTSGLRAYEEQQDFIRKEEAFIKKHMGSQRTAEAKGREKKLSNLTRLPCPHNDVRKPVIRARKSERSGERVLEARDLTGGYPGKRLFQNVELRIGRGERIGIVGKNGAGKTTLLRILAGRLAPLAGSLELGHKAFCGYYDQDTSDLREDSSPYLELRRHHGDWTDQQIRDLLARFLFRGEDVDSSIASLSGGERARLALSILLSHAPNWLAMDEPTNHLDLAARTALEEMLAAFDGTLIFVSHDRAFLDELCTQIIEVQDGEVRRFTGNYSEYRRQKLAQQTPAEKPAPAKPAPKEKEKPAKSAPGKIRNPYLFEKLEKRIMTLEAELKTLHAASITEDVYRNPAKLRDTQMRIAEVEHELAQSNDEWEQWVS